MIVTAVKTRERVVALTFDDGPDERFTPALLDVLEDASAPASFFVLGCALNPRSEQIVARMHAAGHDVCNHTYSHLSLADVDAATIEQEILRTHHALEEITQQPPTLVRPPYGHGFTAVDEVARTLGYRATVHWSAWADDWTLPPPPAATIVDRVSRGHAGLKGVRRGGIVLLHDGCAPDRAGQSRGETVDAVRALIPRLRSDGYGLVTVSDLLEVGGAAAAEAGAGRTSPLSRAGGLWRRLR